MPPRVKTKAAILTLAKLLALAWKICAIQQIPPSNVALKQNAAVTATDCSALDRKICLRESIFRTVSQIAQSHLGRIEYNPTLRRLSAGVKQNSGMEPLGHPNRNVIILEILIRRIVS